MKTAIVLCSLVLLTCIVNTASATNEPPNVNCAARAIYFGHHIRGQGDIDQGLNLVDEDAGCYVVCNGDPLDCGGLP